MDEQNIWYLIAIEPKGEFMPRLLWGKEVKLPNVISATLDKNSITKKHRSYLL